MKKFIYLFLTFFIVGSLFANPITQKQAEEVAQNYYQYKADGIKTNVTVKSVTANVHKGLTTFYIVRFEEGGFVIVSANDAVKPVLGYSVTNEAPENITNSEVEWWLENYSKQIEYIVDNDLDNSETIIEWNNIRNNVFTKSDKTVNPLLTTNWSQDGGYNNYCPAGTPSGCVATAMAQIMKYHDYPETGVNWHQYTHPSYGVQTSDFVTGNYNWASMGTSGGDAVAWLIYHCGVSVDMDYAPAGSGAQSSDAAIALANYFKYDQGINFVSKDGYTNAAWITLLKDELDASRPVYYSGSGPAYGHAFVFDGYDASDNFHVNWGWGGYLNGNFAVGALNPGGDTFNENNAAIIGIQPAASGEEEFLFVKKYTDFPSVSEYPGYISAVDDFTAWATGRDGSGGNGNFKDYTRTTDGGATWTAGSVTNLGGTAFSMIHGLSADVAYIAMYGTAAGNKILRTTDGGANWESVLEGAGSSSFFNVVHFFNENDGFAQGDAEGGEYELYTTTDGGDSWTRVPGENIPDPEDAGEYGIVGYYTAIGDVIWYTTNNGYVYKSSDKGYTWAKYQIFTASGDTNISIAFDNNGQNGLALDGAGTPKTFHSTTDGGATWTQINPTGDFYSNDISSVPGEANTFVSVGSDFETPAMGVSYSTDGGYTWENFADYYSGSQFISIDMVSSTKGFAGTFCGEWSDGMFVFGEPSAELLAQYTASDAGGVDSLFCANTDVTFTNSSTGVIDSYTWDFGADATPASATGVGPHNVQYANAGTKTVSLTIVDANTSESDIYESDVTIATTTPNDIDAINGPQHVLVTTTETYSVAEQENSYFAWTINPSLWTGESNTNEIDIYFAGFITGSIEVFAYNGCGEGGSAELEIDYNVSVSELENNISIYPNPVLSSLNILNAKNSIINIYTTKGKLVSSYKITNNDFSIDPQLDAGLYLIDIIIDGKKISKKIVVK